jgi:hypothetical protein
VRPTNRRAFLSGIGAVIAGSVAVDTVIAEEDALSGSPSNSTEGDTETADWQLADYDNANTLYNSSASHRRSR